MVRFSYVGHVASLRREAPAGSPKRFDDRFGVVLSRVFRGCYLLGPRAAIGAGSRKHVQQFELPNSASIPPILAILGKMV